MSDPATVTKSFDDWAGSVLGVCPSYLDTDYDFLAHTTEGGTTIFVGSLISNLRKIYDKLHEYETRYNCHTMYYTPSEVGVVEIG